MKYRYSLEEIKDCTNKSYENIYMVGGGNQSKLLCQMTANACKCNVVAGSSEATVLGNIAIQFIATGEIEKIEEAVKKKNFSKYILQQMMMKLGVKLIKNLKILY